MATFDETVNRLPMEASAEELAEIGKRLHGLAQRIPTRIAKILQAANAEGHLGSSGSVSALGNANIPNVERLSQNMTDSFQSVLGNLSSVADALEGTSKAVITHAETLARKTRRIRST